MTLRGEPLSDDPVEVHELLFQVAPPGAEPFGLGEGREHRISEDQVSFSGRHEKAQAGQVMELAEGPGERRLAPIVRAGDYQDVAILAKVESLVTMALCEGREVTLAARARSKASRPARGPGRNRKTRIAEGKTGFPQGTDVVEIGKVELRVTVESGNCASAKPW